MNKLGIITVGQSPRNDVMPEILPYLGKDVQVLQIGALDGMLKEEIVAMKPTGEDYVLISTMEDGSVVKFAEKYIVTKLQKCIEKLEEEKVNAILFICTGTFPNVFTSKVPIIYPQKIMHSIVPHLTKTKKIGVIIPDESQVLQTILKWKETGLQAIVTNYSPYKDEDLKKSLEVLNNSEIDIIIMDCIGYNKSMKEIVKKDTGKPVILGRSLAARVTGALF